MLHAVEKPHHHDHDTEFYHPATKKFQYHHTTDLEDFTFPESGMASAVMGPNSYFLVQNSHADKDTFEVKVDIHHYRPEELLVKTVNNNFVVVTGKHEERHKDNGKIVRDTREFVQRYTLPEGVIADSVTCFLCTADGMLHISAPMHHVNDLENEDEDEDTPTFLKEIPRKHEESVDHLDKKVSFADEY